MWEALSYPQGRFLHAGLPGLYLVTRQYRTSTDHLGYPPPPEWALIVLEAREGTSLQDQTT
jgi:hypothetical protein